MEINGHTRMAAVVAKPIKHSLSPFIHNRAFELTEENGVYLAWEIEEENLGQVIENVKSLEMYGLNISMPYKQETLEYMDYLTDEARLIGAVNTVINYEGKLIGHNTDGIGFFKSLAEFDFSAEDQVLTVIGGGGAAMAIIAQASLLKAKKINVFARQSRSYLPLQNSLKKLSDRTQTEISLFDLENEEELQEQINRSSLLVQTTSVGMDGKNMPISEKIRLPEALLVADVIYKVEETPFLKWANAQGVRTTNGLGMLVEQAAESFKMWTGKEMPVATIKEELGGKL